MTERTGREIPASDLEAVQDIVASPGRLPDGERRRIYDRFRAHFEVDRLTEERDQYRRALRIAYEALDRFAGAAREALGR